MNEQEIKRLQKNLTKSAKKAKKFWVRGMVGLTESDQGFFDVLAIPVQNQLTHKPTTLGELLSDLADFETPVETLEKESE